MNDDGQLKRTEYYVNIKNGDLYLINWKQNRPHLKNGWIKISKLIYKLVSSVHQFHYGIF